MMETLFAAIEKMNHLYEKAPVRKRYKLSREEYIYLYGTSQGHGNIEFMAYFNRQKSFIYDMRQRLVRKFSAKHFHEVLYLFGQCHQKNNA